MESAALSTIPFTTAISPVPRDEFMMWLSFINPGMLLPSNLGLMNYAINNMPDGGIILEIGSFAGLSLNHIIHLAKRAGRQNEIFSVDEWNFEGSNKEFIPETPIAFWRYRLHVMETFRQNLHLFHPDRLPHHIVASSDNFFDAWSKNLTVVDYFGRPKTLGAPISFAYIDGAHTYDQSMRDFENVDKYLLPGGIILFDDSADGSGWGSQRTASEAASRPGYQVIDKTANYCIRKDR